MRRGFEERLAAWVTLLQAHAALVDALGRELEAQRGIPLAWYEVLLRLSTNGEGRLRMLDLSRSLLLSKSGVTRLIDRVEEAGLVTRRPSPDDRRVVWVSLTPSGKKTFESAMPVHLGGIERHFTGVLSLEELRQLRSALRKVLEANGQPAAACHSPSDFSCLATPARAGTRSGRSPEIVGLGRRGGG